jgi:transcriptional regulator with XRE-family HTH domain
MDDRSPLAVRLVQSIRMHRVQLGVSQEEFARLTCLHRNTIDQLEVGLNEPKLGTIVKLAGALEVPLGSLLAGIDWSVGKKTFVIEDQAGVRGG